MTKTAVAEAYLDQAVAPSLPMVFWKALCRRMAKHRCRIIHRSISLPVHGKYRCWTCLQEFDTDF